MIEIVRTAAAICTDILHEQNGFYLQGLKMRDLVYNISRCVCAFVYNISCCGCAFVYKIIFCKQSSSRTKCVLFAGLKNAVVVYNISCCACAFVYSVSCC
jgi:hypothetical protein